MAEIVLKPISLLEVFQKSTGFDGALLATFNAFLPFLEEVVLRRLRAAGCHYAVALMDGRQLGEDLAITSRRPSLAGRRYGLLPIECGGVFHPKVALLIGAKASRILIGSHNLSVSAFLHNREITNQIDVQGPKDREGAAALLEVLSFCRAWVGLLPEALQEVLNPFDAFSRRYLGPVPEDAELKVVGSRPDGPDLWMRVRRLLPTAAKRVTFLGPFYDDKLSFVARVMDDLQAEAAVVGLDPTTGRFPGNLKRLPRGVRVVDSHGLDPGHKGRGYLHGKAILIESRAARFLITGSANPTAAAWLKPANGRNAEIVVIRKLSSSGEYDLGMGTLWRKTSIAPSALSNLRAGHERPKSSTGVHLPLVGIREGPRIRIEGSFSKVRGVAIRGADHTELPSLWEKKASELAVDVGDRIDEASALEVFLDDTTRFGFVHHGSVLRKEAAPSSERRLREAMRGLSGDPTQLEKLLKLVEKVIFDAPAAERALGRKSPLKGSGGTAVLAESTAGLVETLARRKEADRHRLSSGDIGILIDFLMRKLWRSISHEQATGTRSEVELIGSDDEEVAPHEFTDREIAEAWHKKSRTLLRRLERRMLTADDAAQVVMETAAVLGVLEALRRVEEQDRWKSLRLDLVDRDLAEDFAMVALPRLLQRGTGLLDLAKVEVGAPFVEEQVLVEWVTWLAWLTGFGPTDAWNQVNPDDGFDEEYTAPTEVADRLARACLIGARLPGADSGRVLELLDATPFSGISSRSWLQSLERLGDVYTNPQGVPRLARAPALGDLVMTDRGAGPFVVQRTRGDKADLIDFGQEKDVVTFKISGLRVLDAGLEDVRRTVG